MELGALGDVQDLQALDFSLRVSAQLMKEVNLVAVQGVVCSSDTPQI